jgi:hypothetical protein
MENLKEEMEFGGFFGKRYLSVEEISTKTRHGECTVADAEGNAVLKMDERGYVITIGEIVINPNPEILTVKNAISAILSPDYNNYDERRHELPVRVRACEMSEYKDFHTDYHDFDTYYILKIYVRPQFPTVYSKQEYSMDELYQVLRQLYHK